MNWKRIWGSYGLLLGAVAVLFLAGICVGSTGTTLPQVARILLGDSSDQAAYRIVWDIRLPRVLASAILGGMLSVSGFLLQTFFANPIAGPYVLGISSGAKLTVAVAMLVLLGQGIAISSAGMVLAAFAGALGATAMILLLSRYVRGTAMLVVGGVMIGYICSAVTDFFVTFADDADIANLHNWSQGSFSGISWANVRDMAVLAAVLLALTMTLAKPMEAYQLGESYAKSLGVNVRRFRLELIILSSLLSACVTAFAGPISFVGIAVPHLVKSLLKTAKPLVVLPACALGGAAFCMLCDLVARTLFAPIELNLSSVTAVFGAPVVIGLMVTRQSRRSQGGMAG